MAKREILVVGEHPRINPRAKSIFFELMEAAGFKEKHFRWIDVLEVAPPEGKNVTKTMIKAAKDRLLERMKKRAPKYVVLLGNTACQAVLDKTGVTKLRGKPIDQDNIIYLPVLHPNQALHDEKWIDVIAADLIKLKDCVRFGGIPEERELDYHVVDTWTKVKAMWADLHGTVAVDLETTRLYPFITMLDELIASGRASQDAIKEHRATHSGNQPCVVAMQFGCRKRQWVVPMETAGIWTHDELVKIVAGCTRRLRKCYTVFHNGKFDCLWMLCRFGVKWHISFDTQNAHYLLDENDFHGLKYLAQKFLGAPDWEIDKLGKQAWSIKNAKYAAHDVFYTRKLRFIFKSMLEEDHDVKRVHDLIMVPCYKLFIEAEFHGVYIDMDKMDDAENYLRSELNTAVTDLEKWSKKAKLVDKKTGVLNWGSNDQLGDLLFNVLKIKPIEKTSGGKNSVSESVLLRIDHPMVGDLLKYRAAQKQLSSFIEGWRPYIDPRGFLHPSFKLHGTVTGRLSCEHPNLQQVPRDPRIRSLIIAMMGWTLMEMDLSQIELRIAAELADEHNLLKVFSEGGDPHWQTAIREIERGAGYKKEIIKTVKMASGTKMSYSEAVEYILGMGGDHAASLMEMWKEVRKKAKAINFGYLYGMWWKKFKLYARDNYGVEVTDQEAQDSRIAFFELYPGFPDWHDKQRRFAQVNGYVRSLSGRKRRLPAAMGNRDTPQRREAQRQAINSPVQSFANELNLMAALQMRREFSKKWFQIVGTVHDSVLMVVRNDMVEHVYKRGLEIMSKPDLLKQFEIEMGVPIEAEAKIGPWSKGVNLEKWLKIDMDPKPSGPRSKAERTYRDNGKLKQKQLELDL